MSSRGVVETASQFLELSKGFLPRKCDEKLWKLRALYLPAVDKIKGRGTSRVGTTAGPRPRWAEMGTHVSWHIASIRPRDHTVTHFHPSSSPGFSKYYRPVPLSFLSFQMCRDRRVPLLCPQACPSTFHIWAPVTPPDKISF